MIGSGFKNLFTSSKVIPTLPSTTPLKCCTFKSGFLKSIFVEDSTKIDLRNPDLKVQHLRGVVEGSVGITFDEVKRFLKPEPIISSIQKGSIVELISGPFKGERAKVVRIDESREEVVLELIEAAVPIPVTVKADQIRIIQKEAD